MTAPKGKVRNAYVPGSDPTRCAHTYTHVHTGARTHEVARHTWGQPKTAVPLVRALSDPAV